MKRNKEKKPIELTKGGYYLWEEEYDKGKYDWCVMWITINKDKEHFNYSVLYDKDQCPGVKRIKLKIKEANFLRESREISKREIALMILQGKLYCCKDYEKSKD